MAVPRVEFSSLDVGYSSALLAPEPTVRKETSVFMGQRIPSSHAEGYPLTTLMTFMTTIFSVWRGKRPSWADFGGVEKEEEQDKEKDLATN